MKKLSLVALFISIFVFPSVSFAKELPKIAVWDLVSREVKPTYAQELTSILASEIAKLKKYEVYTQENVRTLAGWTEERMKLGCTSTQCLTALGQMDIAKLISGSVGKIGNRYSVSLNLFDTQNARSENMISEFCRSEDELIDLVQVAVRKLLGEEVVPSKIEQRPSPSTGSEIGRDGRFIAYNNGTVLDTRTNLMWAAKDNGSDINWADAKSYCENYRGGGYTDWRMPTQDELAGLYDSAVKRIRTGCGLDVHLTELIRLTVLSLGFRNARFRGCLLRFRQWHPVLGSPVVRLRLPGPPGAFWQIDYLVIWFFDYFLLSGTGRSPVRYKLAPRFHNLTGQYRWFCRRYFKSIIFFQVGRYFEFYGHLGKFARDFFHLRAGASRPRLGIRVGFPVNRLERYLRAALAVWPQVVLIRQTGRFSGYVMERRVHSILLKDRINAVSNVLAEK